jgi:hypothetical protein
MRRDGKPKLGKESFGDFTWKCETTSDTYDNLTTFVCARDSLADRRRPLFSAGYLNQPFRSKRDSASVAQPEPSAAVLDGFDVDDYVKTGKPPDEHAARDLTDVRERSAIN